MNNKHLKLFISSMYLSTFTFGGGFVIISLMQKKYVEDLAWIKADEMLDLMSLAQSAPGSIAINASIMVGYRVAGFRGALVAILGTVLPPLCIMVIVSQCYDLFKANPFSAAIFGGMRAGLAAIIIDVAIPLFQYVVKKRKCIPILVMLVSFIATQVLKINVMYLILISGFVGVINIKRER